MGTWKGKGEEDLTENHRKRRGGKTLQRNVGRERVGRPSKETEMEGVGRPLKKMEGVGRPYRATEMEGIGRPYREAGIGEG